MGTNFERSKNKRGWNWKAFCNFMSYSKLEKIAIKRIRIKCEEAYLKFRKGWCYFWEEERDKEGKKEKVIGVKPEALLLHMAPHHAGGVESFQTPPQKAVFGGWMALKVLSEQCRGHSHVGACYTHATKFF